MKIDEVITQTILAIYKNEELANRLFLKGGSAMRLFDKLTSRLSIDADFSLENTIDHEKQFFNAIKAKVKESFKKLKFDIIDFNWGRRPKNLSKDRPDWWGGWFCEFKLVAFSHRKKPLTAKRRNALV